MLLTCKNSECGKVFSSIKSSRHFCSKKCSVEDRKKDPVYLEKLRKPKINRICIMNYECNFRLIYNKNS